MTETSQPESKRSLSDIQLSVLDLASIRQGGNAAEAFRNSMNLARKVDEWGFNRYWLAEHHSIPGVASSATSVLIGHIASGTSRIRVGSGGIMLPNHAPLVIAEQFGTLESLYPGRIDLGLGRAPGSDQKTSRALRRDIHSGQDFPELLAELRAYFKPDPDDHSRVKAVPGEGLSIPIWLLGSSDFSARLAGQLGLPFAFAGQFAPTYMLPALSLYRQSFRPSAVLDKPYAMVGVQVCAADTDEQAERLATSLYRRFLGLIRNQPTMTLPPVDSMDGYWTPQEKYLVESQLSTAIIGSPATVKAKLERFVELTEADELMILSDAYDQNDRIHSFEIIKNVWRGESK
ncbi:LLM class flavin-dependent oxidoreductase [Paenibacillus sp. GCM10012307]|uniref:LLM class flavin-dependent oxidoreductase n=1 Tax=Paenibacillus roseus TaxID=2798579 RepID=A0A934J4H4_9BACL|nr:LLM class flavin-dependent oxidoreductase [Paenibacillus roseus]MBJ6362700.1 LLM class flavin-dependent oxidoreductase [Paenibacillus roseus]